MPRQKIKFALKMKDGVEVRSFQELQENFDLNQVTAYFLDGRLETGSNIPLSRFIIYSLLSYSAMTPK